jgi:hypothetical protein
VLGSPLGEALSASVRVWSRRSAIAQPVDPRS